MSSTWRIPRVLGAGRVDEDQEYISYYKLQYHTQELISQLYLRGTISAARAGVAQSRRKHWGEVMQCQCQLERE